MRKFAEIRDSPAVPGILDRLHAAGIEAKIARGESVGTIYAGGAMNVQIWVNDDADDATVRRIIDETPLHAQAEQCPVCGYSLLGHEGKVNCPECGTTVFAGQPDKTCAECGEVNPGTFETCWHCDSTLPEYPAETRIADGPSLPSGVTEVDPPPSAAGQTTSVVAGRVLMFILIAAVVLLLIIYGP